MAIIKFTTGQTAAFDLSQIKVMKCGKLVAPFGLVQMRECEIVEYIK
nr:MAG TPA: hypothetical protein [Bacteriophage sp.]